MPDGTIDAELTTLARDPAKKLYAKQSGFSGGAAIKKQSHIDGWHTDISFEVRPSSSLDLCNHTLQINTFVTLAVELMSIYRTFLQTIHYFT